MPDVRPNKLGITDAVELVRAEGDLAGKRLIDLRDAPICDSFDIQHRPAVNKAPRVLAETGKWRGRVMRFGGELQAG